MADEELIELRGSVNIVVEQVLCYITMNSCAACLASGIGDFHVLAVLECMNGLCIELDHSICWP